MKTFGTLVAEARRVIRMSQKELASRVKKEDGQAISPQYLNDVERDRRNLVVHRGSLSFVVLNLFPYTTGHLMIAPYQHLNTITAANADQLSEMMQLSQRAIGALTKLYHPEGFNLGMNLGTAAGAGIREHFHLHVVPRWSGDANFMSVVGETRVLPEELSTTYRRLQEVF